MSKRNNTFVSRANSIKYTKDKEDRCTICQELYTETENKVFVIVKPCLHVFHKSCLDGYINVENQKNFPEYKCPICRKEITSIDKIDIYKKPLNLTILSGLDPKSLKQKKRERLMKELAKLEEKIQLKKQQLANEEKEANEYKRWESGFTNITGESVNGNSKNNSKNPISKRRRMTLKLANNKKGSKMTLQLANKNRYKPY
jgi:hypothetical protein